MGLFDGLFGGSETYNLEPMLTDEQKQAQKLLLSLSNGGSIAGLNLGDLYSGSLGNYNLSPTTQGAVNSVSALLNAGTPSAYQTAENTLTKLADTSFNPSDPSSGYAAYQRQVARATNDANDVINREAAITGNRFGDRILNTKSDLAAQQSDILATKLAELFNAGQNRALSAASGLTSLGTAQNQTALNTAQMAANLGDLQRMLDTAKAQAQYSEWQRARNERLGTSVDALNSLWGKNVDYGMKSYTQPTSSPFSTLLNAGLGALGTAFGGPIGGMLASGIGSLFGGSGSSNSSSGNILNMGVGLSGGSTFGL